MLFIYNVRQLSPLAAVWPPLIAYAALKLQYPPFVAQRAEALRQTSSNRFKLITELRLLKISVQIHLETCSEQCNQNL
jgi:hypothetical protein